MIKSLVKRTVPLLPGYHALCLLLRRARRPGAEWIDRVPIVPGTKVLVHSSVGDFHMARPERCSIAKKYFWTGGIRHPLEDRAALNLFASLARRAEVALDIGANSGLFSIVAAKANPASQVVAFDILPEAYHTLVDNLILNGLMERVEIHLAGVGASGGVFHAPFDNISSEMPSSLSLDIRATGNLVAVPVRSLDEICIPRFRGKALAIKIDVEGTEVDIFEGGAETLRAMRCGIVCEVLARARRFERYDEILAGLSYRKFLITDQGLRPFERVAPQARFKDWFFTNDPAFTIETEELLR